MTSNNQNDIETVTDETVQEPTEVSTVDPSESGVKYFEVYGEYSRTLRAWFVAYGVGAPVLFLTQERISTQVADSGFATLIVNLFLLGVAFQVFLALLNKWVNWVIYAFGDSENHKGKFYVTAADKVSEWFWLDFLLDVGSFAAFAAATILMLRIFV